MIQTPGKHQPKKNTPESRRVRDCMSGVSSNSIDPLPGLGNVREGVFAKSKSCLSSTPTRGQPRVVQSIGTSRIYLNPTRHLLSSHRYRIKTNSPLFFTHLFIPDRSSATCVSIVLDFLRFFWVMTFDMFLQRNQLHLFFYSSTHHLHC